MTVEERSKWHLLLEASVGAVSSALLEESWLSAPSGSHLPTLLASTLGALPDDHPALLSAYATAATTLATTTKTIPSDQPARAHSFAAARSIGQGGMQHSEGSGRRNACLGLVGQVAPMAVVCLCDTEEVSDAKSDPKVEAFKLVLVAFNLAEESQKSAVLELFVPVLAQLTEPSTPSHLTQLATATIMSMATNPLFKAQLALLPDAMKLSVGAALKANASGGGKTGGGGFKAAPKAMKKINFSKFG